MKQYTIFAIVVVNLVVLVLALNALFAGAAVLSAPMANPPVPPVDAPTTLRRLPSTGVESVGQTQAERPIVEETWQVGTRPQALPSQAGKSLPLTNLGWEGSSVASPQGQTCQTMLLNPQMDVTVYGVTGTIDSWAVPVQTVYFDDRPGYYSSPATSLAMMDELDGSDTAIISSTLDYDQFGQGFLAPKALTVITVTYSRLYTNANSADAVFGNLWELDDQGKPTNHYYRWSVGESPSGWSNRLAIFTDSTVLADISGKPWALVFEMYSNRQAPAEIVWLDDAQVTACYATGPVKVYLPIVLRQPPLDVLACTPFEPDSATQRGATVVGATCHGSFSAFDMKDYFNVDPKGATQVRLWLRNLPSGSNWNATLWEDANGSYINPCNIGAKGDQDKSADCTLNLSKKYFVVVGTTAAPGASGNAYDMIVESRSAQPSPTPTPTSTPLPSSGIYGQVKYNGSPAAGIKLILRFYNGSSWSTWGSPVTTDSNGNYRFTGVPSLGAGQKYYVRYNNGSDGNTTNSNYLAWWVSYQLTSYSAGSNVFGGNFDIADVKMVSPAAGSTVTLPRQFTWSKRSATTTDSYEFDLFDPTDYDPWAYSNKLGYVNTFTMGSLPSGFSYGVRYGWDVWVYGPDGDGEAYYTWYVTFSSTAQGTEGEVTGREPNVSRSEKDQHSFR